MFTGSLTRFPGTIDLRYERERIGKRTRVKTGERGGKEGKVMDGERGKSWMEGVSSGFKTFQN